ncbi:MAG TPA: methyltransferase, partial [Fibrobacteria bacterium]|nr:methyltransferase [Fibrobacteria bacterium]
SLVARRLGARELVATDVSAAAAGVARRNFAEAEVPGTVICADLAEGLDGTFDRILANPPFHEGPDTDYGLPGKVLDAALPLLAPEGRMFLVANQFLDYPAQAARRAHACETLAHHKGFKVYKLAR